MNIEQAARAERTAEQDRLQAEAEWRAAWWDTTLALAALDDKRTWNSDGTYSSEVITGYDVAEMILGQHRDYLGRRRAVGLALTDLKVGEVRSLPPRLALAYVEAKGDPEQAVSVLSDAEAREVSLRDFARELGTQPPSWQREGERTFDPSTLTPEQKAEAARQILADPDTAEQVMADPETREQAMAAVIRSHERANLDRPRPQPAEHKPAPADVLGDLIGILLKGDQFRDALVGWAQNAGPVIRSDDVRQSLHASAQSFADTFLAVLAMADSEGSMDDALARLLEQEDRK